MKNLAGQIRKKVDGSSEKMILEDFLQFATGIHSPTEETTIEIAFLDPPRDSPKDFFARKQPPAAKR